MATQYKHLFFDLDHTLWDFDRNSKETLAELYQQFELPAMGVPPMDQFYEAFMQVNYHMWHQYNLGQIDKHTIRNTRFPLTMQKLGLTATLPVEFGELYIANCSAKPHTMPHAHEVLAYLAPKYQLHIITNGFEDSQWHKLRNAGLDGYFKEVVTSERAASKKPSSKIFEYALSASGATVNESLMIGDNLDTDIAGAKAMGIKPVFYNPHKTAHSNTDLWEIDCLRQLTETL